MTIRELRAPSTSPFSHSDGGELGRCTGGFPCVANGDPLGDRSSMDSDGVPVAKHVLCGETTQGTCDSRGSL